jgi:hypothetical protein
MVNTGKREVEHKEMSQRALVLAIHDKADQDASRRQCRQRTASKRNSRDNSVVCHTRT